MGEFITHTDGIVSLRLWQLSNQVDTDDLPGLRGNVMRVKWIMRALPDGFGSLALLTPFYILPDVPGYPWSPVIASNQFMSLVSSWMSCQG